MAPKNIHIQNVQGSVILYAILWNNEDVTIDGKLNNTIIYLRREFVDKLYLN